MLPVTTAACYSIFIVNPKVLQEFFIPAGLLAQFQGKSFCFLHDYMAPIIPISFILSYKYLSRSYTVLIFPDKTLINVGFSQNILMAVGRESSTSEDFKMGLTE